MLVKCNFLIRQGWQIQSIRKLTFFVNKPPPNNYFSAYLEFKFVLSRYFINKYLSFVDLNSDLALLARRIYHVFVDLPHRIIYIMRISLSMAHLLVLCSLLNNWNSVMHAYVRRSMYSLRCTARNSHYCSVAMASEYPWSHYRPQVGPECIKQGGKVIDSAVVCRLTPPTIQPDYPNFIDHFSYIVSWESKCP